MPRRRKKPESFQGPLPLEREHLLRLPKTSALWQVDARSLAATVRNAGRTIQPWMIVAVSRSGGQILAFDLSPEPPTTNQVWHTLFKAMTQPAAGQPHRPTEIQVRPEDRFEPLHGVLADLGITITATQTLDLMDQVFGGLAEHLLGQEQQPPGLLNMPNMTPEAVGEFFQAAAEFYQRAPWKKVGESTIQVACSKYTSGPWYAVLMGQAGMTSGLVLYDSLETLHRIKRGDLSEEENARLTSALAVVFGDEEDLPVADLEAIERYGWKVAGPDAYPSVYRKEPGLSMRPPLAWELEQRLTPGGNAG
jgi:hypothetical protein